MTGAIFFISALLIVIASLLRYDRSKMVTSFGIILTSVCYCAFCFMAYGKISGILAAQQIEALIAQQGYDSSRLPMSIDHLVNIGLIGGIAFNLFTTVWIALKGGFWYYCLTAVVLFCLVGLLTGPFIGLNPIYSLFGLCCGFMASVAWVLGLTYVEFCVIGNIWVPIVAIIASVCAMVYSTLSNKGCSAIMKYLIVIICGMEMVAVIAIGTHYALPMNEAFYLCVKDLNQIAHVFHTTYEVVNIVIYVVGIVILLIFNIVFVINYRHK